ncbi:survival of motor neuron-related-splicing factor 30-like [Planoprotostelium fungivorum]|uniref:Survival of motor neuron-related-splicing factor 30-like n=1 Tax=Planoprotostelium fungivorum TaxID=1890364 RepID=A0A2P6N5M7_9EUKA|nr:survival of motor neuron-related-splicing factor 30-like [Planoprotostelium fungivorum]
MSSSSSIEELQSALNTYNDQFAQISAALKEHPDNADLLKVKGDLVEVINLTESLLKAKRKPTNVTPVAAVVSAITQKVQQPSQPKPQTKRPAPQPEPEEDEDEGGDQKEFVIPKKLRLHPTDSEEERERKRKRIKSMKSQFRKKQTEGDRKERTTAWQDFNSKGKKTGLEKKKESIFKSPDSVNGRVGVTGSGKGVTPQNMFNVKTVPKGSGGTNE